MDAVLLVMTNVPNQELAQRMAGQLLEKNLAACVNIFAEIRSVYKWDGEMHVASEIPLFIKTTQGCYAQLQELIVSLHPYELPEIIALPVTAGLPAYLHWINKETGSE